MSPLKLSIIIVSYHSGDDLRRILPKFSDELRGWSHEVIVVDNAPTDGAAEMIRRELPYVRLVEPGRNLMYGKGNNAGLEVARGEWLFILNPDVDWQPGVLRRFLDRGVARKSVGVVGPRITAADGRIQRTAHHRFPSAWTVFVDYCLPVQQFFLRWPRHPYLDSRADHRRDHTVAHLTGVCLLLPRATFLQTGGFDPRFTLYLEETEWQKRMADLGLECYYLAADSLVHYGSSQKTFAQASRHYLWGLRRYADRHWSGDKRFLRLRVSIWLATVISDVILLGFWPLSWFLGRAGRRLRHYARAYARLTFNLLRYPQQPPTPS